MSGAKTVRRCRCHQQIIYVRYGVEGYEVRQRVCMVSKKTLPLDQTYIGTWDSPEELNRPPEAPVQKGCVME